MVEAMYHALVNVPPGERHDLDVFALEAVAVHGTLAALLCSLRLARLADDVRAREQLRHPCHDSAQLAYSNLGQGFGKADPAPLQKLAEACQSVHGVCRLRCHP